MDAGQNVHSRIQLVFVNYLSDFFRVVLFEILFCFFVGFPRCIIAEKKAKKIKAPMADRLMAQALALQMDQDVYCLLDLKKYFIIFFLQYEPEIHNHFRARTQAITIDLQRFSNNTFCKGGSSNFKWREEGGEGGGDR